MSSAITWSLVGTLRNQRSSKALATSRKDSCPHIEEGVGASCHLGPQGTSIPHGDTSAMVDNLDCTASFLCDMTVIFK